MNATHVTSEELERFRRGELAPDELIAVARHLPTCRDCSDIASRLAEHHAPEGLVRAFLDDDSTHLKGEMLFDHVDGRVDANDRDRLDAHVANCEACREDVDDLRSLARRAAAPVPPGRRRRPGRGRLIAASAIAAAIAIVILLPRLMKNDERMTSVTTPPVATTPPPEDPTLARWNALVANARKGVLDEPPALREVRGEDHALRSGSEKNIATLSPDGVVVEETRPTFRWDDVAAGACEVVVFRGEDEVTSSGATRGTSWQCNKDLARGVTYRWQLRVTDGDAVHIYPTAPREPAAFRVVDDTAARELADARTQRPNDHLLLATLYARNGILDRADAELKNVPASDAEPLRRWIADRRRR